MSLRLRSALGYGGLTGLVVLLVGLTTYAIHTRAHYDDLDRVLHGTAVHVVAQSRTMESPAELSPMLAVPLVPNVAIRVYGPAGQVLASGPNAALAPLVDPQAASARPSDPPFDRLVGLVPAFARPAGHTGIFTVIAGSDEHRWRLYVQPAEGSIGYVLTAAPLDWLDTSVAGFRRLVLLLTAVGALGTFAAAWLVGGAALRPVVTLTSTAADIAQSGDFKRRVPAAARRDELGRLASTVNAMLDSLERAYEAQQRFVADASHELRAPLTAIQANLELLERQADMLPAERREAIHEASREAHRLARLVADLLALARADAGIPLRRQRVDLDRVLLEALGEARHLARGRQVELAALETMVVAGDPDRLKQLLLVLLDNALKYTPQTGTVTLTLRRDGAVAEVEVRDMGVGIPPADLAHVFERFYRADPARARDPGGTGLGLPIARWIVEQHDGEIRLASEPGRGTVATVRLPLAT